jgi:hypothetical protein
MNKCFSKLILVTLALLPGISLCADIKTIEIKKEKNLYHMHINATIDADVERYKNYYRLRKPSFNQSLPERKQVAG